MFFHPDEETEWSAKSMMKHFLVMANPYKEQSLAVTERICNYLKAQRVECIVDANLRDVDVTSDYEKLMKIPAETDCVIVVGGDGTLIRAAREILERKIPILGVNLGTLGYMTDIEVQNIEETLKQVLNGRYQLEERMRLYATVEQQGKIVEDDALNEICITRSGSLKIFSFHIYINGEYLYTYHADGMIFSTPTGSTAYNLSAGGPIVEPGSKMMILTPICPHSLNSRSIVISDEDEITIKIPDNGKGQPQEAELNFDGRRIVYVHTGDVIRITKSERTTTLIKMGHTSFLETVHRKIMNH